jgi:hypothetical protein
VLSSELVPRKTAISQPSPHEALSPGVLFAKYARDANLSLRGETAPHPCPLPPGEGEWFSTCPSIRFSLRVRPSHVCFGQNKIVCSVSSN